MADQYFHADLNRFWIDLHKCATYEATSIVNKRIDECYSYGIAELELIYGTPDNYEGSIQQAVTELANNNEKVDHQSEIHAGVILKLAENSEPLPQDDTMSFSAISASYENWHRAHQFERDYFPCRKEVSTVELSKDIGCSMEYIRNILNTVSTEDAESIVEYNELTGRNEKRWRIYRGGADQVHLQWHKDLDLARTILGDLGASTEEVESILLAIKKPFKSGKSAISRFKGALTRERNKKEKL